MTDGFTQIGSIVKAHGMKGEVVVSAQKPHAAKLHDDRILWIPAQNGFLEPFRIESVKEVIKSGYQSFFVKFDRVHSRTEAEDLRYKDIFLNNEEVEHVEIAETDLREYQLFYAGNTYLVIDVVETPAHLNLLVLMDGVEVLVPLVEEYIVEINDEQQSISAINLDRLREIYAG